SRISWINRNVRHPAAHRRRPDRPRFEILEENVSQPKRGCFRRWRKRSGPACRTRRRRRGSFGRGRGRRACAGECGRWLLGQRNAVANEKNEGRGDCVHNFILGRAAFLSIRPRRKKRFRRWFLRANNRRSDKTPSSRVCPKRGGFQTADSDTKIAVPSERQAETPALQFVSAVADRARSCRYL